MLETMKRNKILTYEYDLFDHKQADQKGGPDGHHNQAQYFPCDGLVDLSCKFRKLTVQNSLHTNAF